MKSYKNFLLEKKLEDYILFNFFGHKNKNYKIKKSKSGKESPRTWANNIHVLDVPKSELINILNAYPKKDISSISWRSSPAKAFAQTDAVKNVNKESGDTVDLKIRVMWDDDFHDNIAYVEIERTNQIIAYIKDWDTGK